ncbi:MAG: hypothetical protein M0P23_03560 [Bacteroidales bacterium]|nr:hypothetical protein [Bacteroidales bacterium]
MASCLLSSCQKTDQSKLRARMQQWDDALWEKAGIDDTDPGAMLDSLEGIDYRTLSHKNRAYYHLLETIARDKSYYVFKNDNAISLSVKWYKKKTDYYNYSRSLFYHAIVLSQIHTNDSLMFFSIKRAEDVYLEKQLDDSLLYARICVFMGSLHYSRGNYDISNNYYEKAASIFKAIGNTDRYISAKMNQVWYLLSIEEQDAALDLLNELDYPQDISDKALSYIYNAYCGYYTAKKDYTKAIEYAKLDFKLNNVSKTPEDSAAHYFSLIKNYGIASIADSTIHFARQLELLLRENNPNNHYYYIEISNAYQQAGLPDYSYDYLYKAYISLRNNIYDNSQQRILELEKKYDLSRKDYELMKATHDKNLLLASVAISLLIIIIMSVASFQYKQLQKQKALLIQEEKEHFATINVLQKKALNLYPKFVEICSVVLQKHFKMELQEDMNKAIDYLKSMLIGELSSMFPVKNEKTDYEHLSNKEQLIYLLSEYGFSNEEIANILLITEANVRSTKSKIKKKSETF